MSYFFIFYSLTYAFLQNQGITLVCDLLFVTRWKSCHVLAQAVPTYSSDSRYGSDSSLATPLALIIFLIFNLCQFKGNTLFQFALVW